MANFKCLPCRARVWCEGSFAEARELCPGCGGPLEPVGDLTDVVGFRALRTRPARRHGARHAPPLMVERVLEAISRLEARPREMSATSDETPGRSS